MNKKKSGEAHHPPHLVLIFPPVWVPMIPHLAIPALTGYLREGGFSVIPMDANVSFFTEFLLTPETLSHYLSIAHGLKDAHDSFLPRAWRELLNKELPLWEASIPRLDDLLTIFREKNRFLEPDAILSAQNQIQGLLYLSSIAYWPMQISFNHYRREDIRTMKDLLALCEDPERNIFLPFYRKMILPQIDHISPDVVGISISSYHQFVAAMTLARLVRVSLPHIHVVVGGKHLLNIWKKLIQDPFVFKHFFHSAILFEGEQPLESLLKALRSESPLYDVPNLIFFDGERLVRGESIAPLPLETLPRSDFNDTPWEKYLVPVRYAPIRMAEGCYWGKCTFCGRYGPSNASFIPPERVLDELEYLIDIYGIHDISVNDDCLPPSYWAELTEGIIRRGLKLSMLIWAKPVSGFTRTTIRNMFRAGVRQIRWGMESAHPRILDLMKKGTTVNSTLRVLRDAKEAGIWNHACIILGFPTETREEARVTLDFLSSNRDIIHSFILYPFQLLENSYIFHHPEEFGIHDLQLESSPLENRISYTTERGMTVQEVQSLALGGKRGLLDKTYDWPFWYYLKLREYLQLYLNHYGLQGVLKMPFQRNGLRRFL